MPDEPVSILIGLTASGKKTVGVKVAERIGAEIISLDSMKIYRGLDIGSAKPTAEDRARVPFHLLDIVDPCDSFSVGEFLVRAGGCMGEIIRRGRRVLFLGGTAFYLNILVNGLIEGTGSDPSVRARLVADLNREGVGKLHTLLAEKDPESAAAIHANDAKRIVRALEVMEVSGHTLSWLKTHRTKRFLKTPPRIAGLSWPKDRLRERIELRTRKMIRSGLVDEVRRILEGCGFGPESGKAIGYRQIIGYLKGEMSLEEATEKIITATCRFSRKQLTWYRRFDGIRWFSVDQSTEVESVVEEMAGYFTGGGSPVP